MTEGRTRLSGRDVAILVPTLNRPQKLTDLLKSVEGQTGAVGRIVIVDGAESAAEVSDAFSSRLPVEYHRCHPPSQIRQRNLGLDALGDSHALVALLDDDIVLEPEAVEEMVACWNRVPPETAGIAFNIVNGEAERYTPLRGLLGICAREPGRVLRNGMTSAISHAAEDRRVQWLPGGATVWRTEVLADRHPTDVQARWAIAEDLLFSYPIGKRRPLYVCAGAQVHHLHVSDYGRARQDRYHGRVQTLWTYHFVTSNPDLSAGFFFFTLFARMAGRFARGAIRFSRPDMEFAFGQASAVAAIAAARLRGETTLDLLDEAGN